MIKVTLGLFARSGVESYFGADFRAGVRAAVAHYALKLRIGRAPTFPPGFLPELSQLDPCLAVELAIDAEDEALIERQALSRGATVDEVVVHAVLIYLAELELVGVAPRRGTGREPCPAD